MPNTIFAGLSQQVAVQRQLGIVANNIANANTPGYKAQNMVFSEYVKEASSRVETEGGPGLSLVLDYGHYQTTTQGSIEQTGNTFDVALEGDGYFGVQTADGQRYTRAGNFRVNGIGELVTASGDLVSGQGGGAITIPVEAREVKIGRDGSISTDQGQVGQIMVVEFENQQELEAVGNGLYNTEAQGTPALNTIVLQGALEGSNVEPVIEVTRMIELMRGFQRTQSMIQTEHERERTMIQRLSRTQ